MTDEAAMEELIAPIRERNRAKLIARLGHVREAIEAGPGTTSDDLRADLHALVGALGTYGWPEGSELLRQIHTSLAMGAETAQFMPALDGLIAQVSAE